jgi:hypothetical protein
MLLVGGCWTYCGVGRLPTHFQADRLGTGGAAHWSRLCGGQGPWALPAVHLDRIRHRVRIYPLCDRLALASTGTTARPLRTRVPVPVVGQVLGPSCASSA